MAAIFDIRIHLGRHYTEICVSVLPACLSRSCDPVSGYLMAELLFQEVIFYL